VQDMTHDDIKIYVADKLERNRSMQELIGEDPEGALGLIEEVVNKADGVFLWVVLVVKSLTSGLCNGDGIVHLRRRLEAIPSDLETLHSHMMKSIDPFDVEEASQMIQIFRASGHDLDLATLERTLRGTDCQTVLKMELAAGQGADSGPAKYKETLKRMNARLNSRCKGLLEALKADPTAGSEVDLDSETALKENTNLSNSQNKKKRKSEETHDLAPAPQRIKHRGTSGFYHSERAALDVSHTTAPIMRGNRNMNNPPYSRSFSFREEADKQPEMLKIFYLHRTVRDYLEKPKVWERLVGQTKPTGFDPYAALLMGYITELKAMNLSKKAFSRGVDIGTKVDGLQVPSSEPCISLKRELSRVISSHWWGEEVAYTGRHWSSETLDSGRHDFESEFMMASQGEEEDAEGYRLRKESS
jgi:hypothetical protein